MSKPQVDFCFPSFLPLLDPVERAGLFGSMSIASVSGVVSGALISLALPVEDRLLVLGLFFFLSLFLLFRYVFVCKVSS